MEVKFGLRMISMCSNSIDNIEEDSFGFVCPKCGARLGVFQTRKVPFGEVERIRKCQTCGETKKTIEREVIEKVPIYGK